MFRHFAVYHDVNCGFKKVKISNNFTKQLYHTFSAANRFQSFSSHLGP